MVFVSPHELRTKFSKAMSNMYRHEVPAYGNLVDLVNDINDAVLAANPQLVSNEEMGRLSGERHGAIRVGRAEELRQIASVFALMDMHPVGYYDLSVAGIPVHSTAFRPISPEALNENPFRVFTSLLRLDLIADEDLRREAETHLSTRQIISDTALEMVEIAKINGGVKESDADEFIGEIVQIFKWHKDARTSKETYEKLRATHPLIADIVAFKGPHINHLTPRVLDIDLAQTKMPERGIPPKAVIEGPPKRQVPILLRQTAFKALEEQVSFKGEAGAHTARFGEIEQRGVALTPKGRALYDKLLAEVRARITPAPDGSNAAAYMAALEEGFVDFPDDDEAIRHEGLAYFQYQVSGEAPEVGYTKTDIEGLIEKGVINTRPITYEDFLPVSAAGIFQSNLGDDTASGFSENANQALFEEALGMKTHDPFKLYEDMQAESLKSCLSTLGMD